MATFQVDTIISKARDVYPELPVTKALAYLNDIRREVLSRIGLTESSNSISLTAGDPDYAIAETSVKIQQVMYVSSATQSRKLEYLPRQELDRKREGWRTDQREGVPSYYTVTWNNTGQTEIHLLPAPSEATSGTYPYLAAFLDIAADLSAGVTFTEDLPSDRVYVEGIVMLWARAKAPQEVALRSQMYEASLSQAVKYHTNRTEDMGARFIPSWMPGL